MGRPKRHLEKLNISDRVKAVDNLEGLVVTAANALTERAREDYWEDMLSEVFDQFARLNAFMNREKRAAGGRIDLLVHHGRRAPLIVDLKTGGHRLDVDSMAEEVARKYVAEVASIINDDVRCQVLGLTFDGECTWSKVVYARPMRNKGRAGIEPRAGKPFTSL